MGSQQATRHRGGRAARGAPGARGAAHVQEHGRERERRAQQLGLADDARDRLGVHRVQREQRRRERRLGALALRMRARAAPGGLARRGGGVAEQSCAAAARRQPMNLPQPALMCQLGLASCFATASVPCGGIHMALVHASGQSDQIKPQPRHCDAGSLHGIVNE
jgi:hypothetical protein